MRRPVVPRPASSWATSTASTTWRASSACGPRPRWARRAQARNVPRSRPMLCQACHTGRIRPARAVRSCDPCTPDAPIPRGAPGGHPRLGPDRAVAGRPVRGAAARPPARVRARAGVRRGVQPARGPGAGVVRAARRARGAAVLDVARGLRPARRRRSPTARSVVAAGGCDFYPGSRTALARVLVRGHRRPRRRRGRPAGPARPAAPRACTPRACSSRRSACRAPGAPTLHRRGDRRGRQGARRRARRAAPPRLGRAGSSGRSRRCRTAARRPRSRARCRTSRPARRSR